MAILDLPLSTGVQFILHAISKENERMAWDLWKQTYPFMVLDLIESKNFNDFKNEILSRQHKYSEKTSKQIEDEMMKVVSAYEGR